ncbi:hypothetical protein FACS1894158_12870 [Betaproteobacteria bacterium]|nr:hypothetical protein FACS1894158_12870 [Betaproteobacteria bacterium]
MMKPSSVYEQGDPWDEAEGKDGAHQAANTAPRRRELSTGWHNSFADEKSKGGLHADNAGDGLLLSLQNLGRVDIEYIARITGLSCTAVLDALSGAIYQNPETWGECFYQGWETADEYLHGMLSVKLRAARQAAKDWPDLFEKNIRALKAALPPGVAAKDIYVTLGSPWVPPDIIDHFMLYLFGHPEPLMRPTVYDPVCHQWHIPDKTKRYNHSQYAIKQKYGEPGCNGLYLLEKTLNRRGLKPGDLALREKQKKMIAEFRDWVFEDPERRTRLTEIYNAAFGFIKTRRYDGSFLTFPGLSPHILLRSYQKNAIARILLSGNTLLAHSVGTGKTFIMIAASMELRRTGRSSKNLFIVPNNLVGQWQDTFLCMYPEARLLCVEPKQFTPARRQAVLLDIQNTSYDGIIMAASCAEQIPISIAYHQKVLDEQLEQVWQRLSDPTVSWKKHLFKIQESMEEEYVALEAEPLNASKQITFDALGVTAMFLDEAHNYKNIPLHSALRFIRGVNLTGSKKCADMLARVHSVHEGGGVVVLATGTPIANSMTDIYTLQQYLQPGTLRFLELDSFDAWAGSFAETQDVFEIDVDANSFRVITRFAQFHNLSELSALFGQVAEFSPGIIRNLPQCDKREDILINKTPQLHEYFQDISARADAIRRGKVFPTDDNLLKITVDGRKAALDLRLVQENAAMTGDKAIQCAKKVAELWLQHQQEKSTQVIFCDTSTPKNSFNVYAEMKRLLISYGIPVKEIAFVHDHDTPIRREALYANVRSGMVRVVLGSTFKLGLGVNIQTRLVALHHLDVPWRPADMMQREGRILREGNQNDRVHIFRYVTEGSFDAYSWQILETKQRFIAQLLGGTLAARSGAELDDTILSYAEIKALAVGNPQLRERIETATKLERLRQLRTHWYAEQETLRMEVFALTEQKTACEATLQNVRQDQQRLTAHQITDTPKVRLALGQYILEAQQAYTRMPEEKNLLEYRGFSVALPARMLLEKPGLWLIGNGRYYVQTGDSAIGCIQRMDNSLALLEKTVEECLLQLNALSIRQSDIETALQANDPYAQQIADMEKLLAKIDKQLGVSI